MKPHTRIGAFLLAATLLAGSARPQTADAASSTKILTYIHNTWDTLSRSMSDCKSVVDPKVTTAPILYLPADLPIIQIDEDWRWETAPSASLTTLEHPLIYIANVRRERTDIVKQQFASVIPCGVFTRARGDAQIEDYAAYCVRKPQKTAAGKIP